MTRRQRSILLGLSIALQLCFMSLPISYDGDGGHYYRTARFFAGQPDGVFTFIRPPAFPAFLIATGQIWPETFKGTLLAHAAMGVATPLLVAGTVATVAPAFAFVAGLVWTASLIPFSYTQVMLAENLYLFLLLLGTYCFARALKDGGPIFPVGAILALFAAGMTRTEAVPIAIFAAALLLRRDTVRQILLACLLCVAVALAWSWQRSVYLGNPALFGSFNNFTGHQLFGRVYFAIGPNIEGGAVRPENGPAAQRLDTFIRRHQKEIFYLSGGKRGTTEEEWITNIYRFPHSGISWNIGEIARRELGLIDGDKMLRDVALEAVLAHPQCFAVMFGDAVQFIGWRNGRLIWEEDSYTSFPFDLSRSASYYLSPAMFKRYRKNHEMWRPDFIFAMRDLAHTTHNVTRNLLAPVFLCFAVFGLLRHFRLAAFIGGVAIMTIAAPSISVGWSMRYEHVTIPFMLMAAAIGLAALAAVWRDRPQPVVVR